LKSWNNVSFTFPFNDDMVKLFKGLSRSGQESDYVFLSSQGKRPRHIRTPFKNAVTKADIKDFRFHDLRHALASHYVMSGGDLISLKEILGHSTLKMVERYSHLASAYKRKMINNLNRKFTHYELFATLASPRELNQSNSLGKNNDFSKTLKNYPIKKDKRILLSFFFFL